MAASSGDRFLPANVQDQPELTSGQAHTHGVQLFTKRRDRSGPLLATNLKTGHGTTQTTIDVIVANDDVTGFEAAPGDVGQTLTTGRMDDFFLQFGGLAQTVFLIRDAGDGSDVELPSVPGYEVGHFLSDHPGHLGFSTNLMHQGDNGPEQTGPQETASRWPVAPGAPGSTATRAEHAETVVRADSRLETLVQV